MSNEAYRRDAAGIGSRTALFGTSSMVGFRRR